MRGYFNCRFGFRHVLRLYWKDRGHSGDRARFTSGEESPNCEMRLRISGTVLDNIKAEQSDGKCNRKIPLGEMLNDECRMMNGIRWDLHFIHHSSFSISSSKGEMVR